MNGVASPVRVLLVDDEALFVDTLAKILRRRGFYVVVTHDAAAGHEALGASRFDVLVLDVKMPGTDGLTALAQLREEQPDLRVILMTGHLSLDDEREAARLGAGAYLLKPVPVEELVACIAALAARPS